ncbi:hypothetical protein ACNFU2_12850 [Chryseobacterium sp. PTM-20240506]|uniref:hypothetical protein n=1 Tax=unclassified Chryseobacterium TaxID=2593645 RepID=UPI0023598EFC|nr:MULTISPECIES: hypothetical protein [unclassified Chryseobacterium]MDC8105780.1 hypothetical protein [Chryseobacterium sp. B21-037]MDQ1804283.1 hypothetical protein [Chryseobacterium sp. CKR4-1]
MRNVIFGILVVFFALLSCRSDEDSIQRIDQIVNLYMKNSAGQDLLNAKKSGSFTAISMNDINGISDNAPVSFALKATADSTLYIEYIAGARRVTVDSISPADRTYESRITLALTKKLTETTNDVTNDVLRIQYHWTPYVFEVSKVFYNDELKFTKQPGAPNVVTIIK